MIGKTIQHRGNRREKIQETFHRGRQELKSKQTVMKNTINENNYSLAWITSTITEAQERLSGLEDKIVQINTADQNKEQRMKGTEDSLSDPWDNIKCTNIRIIWLSEEEEKEKRRENIFEEIIVENFPSMGKERGNQVQEAQRVSYRIIPRRNTPRHVFIKLLKSKCIGNM